LFILILILQLPHLVRNLQDATRNPPLLQFPSTLLHNNNNLIINFRTIIISLPMEFIWLPITYSILLDPLRVPKPTSSARIVTRFIKVNMRGVFGGGIYKTNMEFL